MQLTELKQILIIDNQIKLIIGLIYNMRSHISNQLCIIKTNKSDNNTASIKTTQIFTLKYQQSLENVDKSFSFIKIFPKKVLNTATVYINGSNCDLITPASAYRLHPGLMLFPQHKRRKRR